MEHEAESRASCYQSEEISPKVFARKSEVNGNQSKTWKQYNGNTEEGAGILKKLIVT